MENYKIKVNNWDESKEVQELFIKLGATCGVRQITSKWVCLYNGLIVFYDLLPNVYFKQITLQQLKDLVILKRNYINDATYYDYLQYAWYLASDGKHYRMQGKSWVYQPYIEGLDLKPIGNGVNMKEYLDSDYELRSVKQTSGYNRVPSGWIEIPEGAEIAIELSGRPYFMEFNGETFDEFYSSVWQTGTITKRSVSNYRKILWQRNPITPNTSTQDKLKFIEKWLNGEKIQYILGIETDKSKWHNFTEGAMRYIKRPDIKFREAPKYVTINGIEFKSVKSLLKYVKNNFDLEVDE